MTVGTIIIGEIIYVINQKKKKLHRRAALPINVNDVIFWSPKETDEQDL